MEEAAELYERAANGYKISKQWSECGNAFQLAAECHMKLQVGVWASDCGGFQTLFILVVFLSTLLSRFGARKS